MAEAMLWNAVHTWRAIRALNEERAVTAKPVAARFAKRRSWLTLVLESLQRLRIPSRDGTRAGIADRRTTVSRSRT